MRKYLQECLHGEAEFGKIFGKFFEAEIVIEEMNNSIVSGNLFAPFEKFVLFFNEMLSFIEN